MAETIFAPGDGLTLERLSQLQERPAPYAPGEPRFWTDPHIAQQMLAAHLDPTTDAASRRPEAIDLMVAWLVDELALRPGDQVLDLGCGPGLYASRLAERGLRVTGVDFSQGSIAYASRQAQERGLQIRYRCQDYLDLDDHSEYETALLIYGDFCPLSPVQRQKLLANTHRALKPHGALVLDVSRDQTQDQPPEKHQWYASPGGFWRPGPHLVLQSAFSYPEIALHLDQYLVIEQTGALFVYRVWRQEYTAESIVSELEAGGFEVQSLWGDLSGAPLSQAEEWIGVVARRA